MTKKEVGMEYFSEGFNCAQDVMGAFAKEMDMTFAEAVKIASPFGGGLGRMREVCGAVSGMCMVLGRLEGYNTPDPEAQKKLYATVQELSEKFRAETGSIICREILGLDKKENDPTPEKRCDAYYKKRPCGETVGIACEILEKYFAEKQ